MKHTNIIEDDESVTVPSLDYMDICDLNFQTAYNKTAVLNAKQCGCFHCGSTFQNTKITEWLAEKDGEDTALCPYCGVDAVIYGTDKFPLSTSLLSVLYKEWFDTELSKSIQKSNWAPDYFGYEDYCRKGIIFQYENKPEIEIVGEIELFSSAYYHYVSSEYEPLHEFSYDEMRAIEQKIIEEVELSHGAIVTAAAYLNDEDYYVCNLIDAHGDSLSYEPYNRSMQDLLLDLTKKYGDKLYGIRLTPYCKTMQLFIDHSKCNQANDDDIDGR